MLGQVAAPLNPAVRRRTAPGLSLLLRTAAGTGTVVLSVVSVGLPGTLVLCGSWSLAFGYGQRHAALRGPASWAAGLVTELGIIASLDFALAVVSGREHGRVPHLLMLLVPIIIGLVAAHWHRVPLLHKDTAIPADETVARPARAGLALVVTIGGLIVPMWVAAHGHGYDVSWALSGDGRNHVLLMRGILSRGGITLDQLRTYPALANALSADISAAGGRHGLAPGSLMLHDARAVSATYVLAGIGLSAMFVAAVLEALPRAVAETRRLPLGVVVVSLLCAVTTASSFVLGSALLDGFFSTYVALPAAVAAVVLAMRCMADRSPWACGLLAVATVFVLFSWTILVVVPVAATVVVLAGLATALPRSPGWLTAVALACGGVLVVLGVFVTQYAKLRKQFLAPGPPPTPLQHWVLYLLGLVVVTLLCVAADRAALRQRAVLAAVAAVGIVTVFWLREITPDGQTWTYYGAKSLWAISVCLLWVGFLPIAMAAVAAPVRERRWNTAAGLLQALAASLAVVLVVGLLTKVKDPLHEAANGWTQPSGAVITEVAALGNQHKAFVLWGFSDPGDDRLADFVAELVWGSTTAGVALPLPGLPGGFYEWGYEDDFTLPSLCRLTRAVPGLTVVTHDAKLHDQLAISCPANGAHVNLVPAA